MLRIRLQFEYYIDIPTHDCRCAFSTSLLAFAFQSRVSSSWIWLDHLVFNLGGPGSGTSYYQSSEINPHKKLLIMWAGL